MAVDLKAINAATWAICKPQLLTVFDDSSFMHHLSAGRIGGAYSAPPLPTPEEAWEVAFARRDGDEPEMDWED